MKLFLVMGATMMALAVVIGAFGAHGLKGKLTPDMLQVYQTGVEYHMYHALGLLAVGLMLAQFPHAGGLQWAGWLMLAGILLFSGSLYVLAISGIRWLGAITPIGGTAFIAGWVAVVVALVRAA